MIAVARRDIWIAPCNTKNARGNRLRKDRLIKAGDRLTVKEFFTSTGLATHGEPCVTVIDQYQNELSTFHKYFDYEE